MRKVQVFILFFCLTFLISPCQEIFKSGKTEVHIKSKFPVELNVLYDGKMLLENFKAGLIFTKAQAMNEQIPLIIESDTSIEYVDPIPLKFKNHSEKYKKIYLAIASQLGFEILFNEKGFIYRWIINFQDDVKIVNEHMHFSLADNDISWFPKEESLISHYERLYLKKSIDSIQKGAFCSLPVLFEKESGANILYTEAVLYNYPAMFLEKGEGNTFQTKFAKFVLEAKDAERGADRNQVITKHADYICNTIGKRTLPWRCFIIAEKDADLLTNTTVFQLSRENKEEDFSWVKPGKVAWDWWNANNITGVDFESGINNETYKYYIDFADEYDLEYIILDEGWSESTTNIMECQRDIDVEELVEYGAERNVGIILWTLWGPLDKDMEEVMSLYESWGVKGVKVDFMQRADQSMVAYYERVAKAAAQHHLLVDFHGAFKPAGLRRAYPNVINYEGLKGLENAKWSKMMTPKHNLTLPFIRMVAGPMDYTPGAMNNAHEENYAIRWDRPMSMGTRCHQVAMYVVYESPLQMLCDNPTNYYKEEESTKFISQIPTTWDETIIFEAKVGEYLLLARRNGNTWYIGGMTVDAQEFEIDLYFLEEGAYQVQLMEDGINSDKNAEDYSFAEAQVNKSDKLKVKMNRGGGFAAIITRK